MKKIATAIKNFFRAIGRIIDKVIINRITKLILLITSRFGKSGKKVEGWLSKSNTLLFISLFLAIIIFVAIDRSIITFSRNSAEVLRSQKVTAIYNEEAYVVLGLPETVDITLIGNKTDLFIAKQSPSSEIRVDLTGLKPGQHRVNLKYNQAGTNLEYMVNPSVATVYIYDKVSETKSLSVDILNQDKLDSKLIIEDVKVENDRIIIKGAEHQLKEVATVKALLDVNNLVSQEVGTTTVKDIQLRAYDENGNIVDVEVVPSKINASVTITSPSKELTIRPIPKGNVAFGKAIKTIDLNVTKVTVYGPQAILNELNYIPLEIDVSELKNDRQFKLNLKNPVGIKYMTVNSVTANVTLDNVSDREVENVRVVSRNLNDKYNVTAATGKDGSVTVNIKGVSSVLNDIKAEDIVAFVDLSGLGEGLHEVDVIIEGTDSRVQYVSKTKKVTVRITKK